MKKMLLAVLVGFTAQWGFSAQALAVTTTTHNCAATNLPDSVLTQNAGADTYKIQLTNCTGKAWGSGKNFFWQSYTGPTSNPPDDIGVEVDIDGTALGGAFTGNYHTLEDGLVTVKNTNAQDVEVWVRVYSSDARFTDPANVATYKITMAAAGSGGPPDGGGSAATPVPALPLLALLSLGGLLGLLGLRRLRQ